MVEPPPGPRSRPADALDGDGDEAGPGRRRARTRGAVVDAALHGERLDKARRRAGARVLAQLPAAADRGRPRRGRRRACAAPRRARVRAGQRIDVELHADRREPGLPARADGAADRLRGRAPAGDRQAGRAGGASGGGQLVAARCSTACSRSDAGARPALPRAGIVHRLDKDTSGLMVVGKHAARR